MRDFDSGENVDLSRLVNFETGPDDPGNDEIDIGMIRVIGNGQKLITRGPGSLRQFCFHLHPRLQNTFRPSQSM